LRRLEFEVKTSGKQLLVTAPDHRLDIGEGVIGQADLMEEIARVYGYERIPITRLADQLPPQRANRKLEIEESIRDLLARLGLQEIMTYRLTLPEKEARRLPAGTPPDGTPYVRLANPISKDRSVLRKSLLASVLEIMERNATSHERMAFFEIGPVFRASEGSPLPDELPRLVLALAGPRQPQHWESADTSAVDFYDIKGVVSALLQGLELGELRFEPGEHPAFHPGRCARVLAGEHQLGVLGELHPRVQTNYDLPDHPTQIATLYLDALYDLVPERFDSQGVPAYPPVLEDLAIVVDESLPAGQVDALIRQTGGKLLTGLALFDVYRGEQLGAGKKSLAYQLTYQHPDRTLTDEEVAKLRERIVKRLEQELGGKLRT